MLAIAMILFFFWLIKDTSKPLKLKGNTEYNGNCDNFEANRDRAYQLAHHKKLDKTPRKFKKRALRT